jgi:hypothetical protein
MEIGSMIRQTTYMLDAQVENITEVIDRKNKKDWECVCITCVEINKFLLLFTKRMLEE